MISIPCLRFTVCNFKIQSPNDLYNKKNLRLFIFFRKDFNMVPRGFLVSFEGSRYSYQLTLMFWLNNGPISNIFRRKCKIKARSCQLFFSLRIHYCIFSFLELHDHAVLIALRSMGVFLLLWFFSLSLILSKLSISSHW